MKNFKNDISAAKKKVTIYVTIALTISCGGGSFFPVYLEPQWLLITLAIISGLILVVTLYGKPHYLWVLMEQDKLKVRYYSVLGYMRKFHAIEIPLNTFVDYEIRSSFFGLRKELILKQRVKNKIGTYPPVYVSALSKKDKASLIAILNQYIQK